MLFTKELDSLAERVSAAHKRTSLYRVRAMETSARLKELRERAAGLSRELGRLGARSHHAFESARIARYGRDSGRMRVCYERNDLLGTIIDGISDALMALREQIQTAEDDLLQFRNRVDAAATLAVQAERRLADARRDRDHYIAQTAGVPEPQLAAESYVIKESPRYPDQIDVYYNKIGQDPVGEQHGHIAVDFDGNILDHRPPGYRRPSRPVSTALKPSPLLFPQQTRLPMAA